MSDVRSPHLRLGAVGRNNELLALWPGEERDLMNLMQLNSCVAKEIATIGLEPPEAVLLQFCRLSEAGAYDYTKNIAMKKGTLTLNAFYIFTGVVDKGEAINKAYPTSVTYAPNLRDYLLKEGLGTVVETEKKDNPFYVSPHKVQVFIWGPDREKMQAWWEGKDTGVRERKEAYVAGEKKREEERKSKLVEQERQAAARALEAQRLYAKQELLKPGKGAKGPDLSGVRGGIPGDLLGAEGARENL